MDIFGNVSVDIDAKPAPLSNLDLVNFDISAPPKKKPKAGGRISRDEVIKRAGEAMARGLPDFTRCINTSREWAIVGGGPSINDCVDDLRRLKKRGVNIVTVNKTHDWCRDVGIVPWGHVLIDPMPWVADYVKHPRHDVRYFMASQCHESVFEALKVYPVFLVHCGQDFENDPPEPHTYLRRFWPNSEWTAIPGPTTVGLRAPLVGHTLGADVFHMFGMDSSRRDGKLHAYAKDEAKDASSGSQAIVYGGRRFKFDTNSHMRQQLEDFDNFMKNLPGYYRDGILRKSFQWKFYGDGLLPMYAAMLGLHARDEYNADPTLAAKHAREESTLEIDPPKESQPWMLTLPNLTAPRPLFG